MPGATTSGADVGDTAIDDGTDDDCGGCCAGFYGGCPPDFGGGIYECDLIAQDCPAGEKCMPWANDGGPVWNATRCSPLAADPVSIGEACMAEGSGVSGVDDCDIGLMCWDVDENNVGHCEDFCSGSPRAPLCENPDDVCHVANGGAVALCLPSCDPLLQSCSPAEACRPSADHWACFLDASGGTALPGSPCVSSFDCNEGLVCQPADSVSGCASETGCCAPLCNVLGAEPDAACTAVDPTAACEPWYERGAAPRGLEHVGVCVGGEDETTGG